MKRRTMFAAAPADVWHLLADHGGLWQVDPDPGGSRVIMRFAYQATPSVRGGLFAIGMRTLFALIVNRIFRGWRRR